MAKRIAAVPVSVATAEEKFTVEEWITEVRKAQLSSNAVGETSRELQSRLGLSKQAVYELLREAAAQKCLKVSRKATEGVDGRKVHVPCYRFLPFRKGKGKARKGSR